jgi:histone-lysine N-methyltransferase SETMAR
MQGTPLQGHTMSLASHYYVGPAIQNKRRGMLTFSIVLLHDNVHLHTAACTQALLKHFNWELSDHPPYSPDLAPSDYNLFTYLKN